MTAPAMGLGDALLPRGRYLDPAGLKVRQAVLDVSILRLDPDYQRKPEPSWIKKNLPWNAAKAGAVTASSRAGGPWVIDGGHRIELARLSGISSLFAIIIDGLTKAQEADIFVSQRTRRQLSSWVLFQGELVALYPEAHDILHLTQVRGFKLHPNQSAPDTINAVDGLRWVYRLGPTGGHILGQTLDTVRDGGWLSRDLALSSLVLKGVALFLWSAGLQEQDFRPALLTDAMLRKPPLGILADAQENALRRRRANISTTAVAEALMNEYNKRAKGKRAPLIESIRRTDARRQVRGVDS